METWVPILLAVLATSGMNFGLALQKRAAVRLPRIGLRGNRGVLAAFLKSRLWRRGLCLNVAGYGLFFYALTRAPVSTVQPVLGFGLAVLALFCVLYLKEKLRLREWCGIGCLVTGVALLGLTARALPARLQLQGLLLLVGVVAAVLLLLLRAGRAARHGSSTAVLLGLAAGLLIGFGFLNTKALIESLRAGALARGLLLFMPAALIGFVAGEICMQSGFQRGRAVVVASMNIGVNKLLVILGGLFCLGEALPAEPLRLALRVTGFVSVIGGSMLLGRFSGARPAKRLWPGPAPEASASSKPALEPGSPS